MPLCQVVTNVSAPPPAITERLLGELSQLLSLRFEKPERWAMTSLAAAQPMTFGGTAAPAAFVAVKNIGTMAPSDTEALSGAICGLLTKALGVSPDRIYIEFVDAVPYRWGWNGGTFA